MKNFKDLAFILKREKFGEADFLITVFSKNHGKIKILAKGSRKIKSKFMGHLEPFSLVNISWVSGKSFEILTGAQIKKSFSQLKNSLKNLSLLNLLSETVDSVTCEKVSNTQIFNLFSEVLNLKRWEEKSDFLVMFFLLKTLSYLGYAPNLDNCIKCQNKDFKKIFFSFYWGSVMCERCSDFHPKKNINNESLKLLRFLASIDTDEIKKIERISVKNEKTKKQAQGIIFDFFVFINDKKPNSLKFIEKTNG